MQIKDCYSMLIRIKFIKIPNHFVKYVRDTINAERKS